MTWRRPSALLKLLCVMASLIPLRMILPGAKKHLGTPRNARNTTRSDLLGWESRPALKPAPAGSPQPTGLLIRVTTWTAHLTPLRSSSCCPGWALDGSLVAAPSLSRVTIGWWRWRRQTLSAGMTRLSAPLRELLWPRNFVATPRRDLCWTCALWTRCLDAGHGPGFGSPRRLLRNFMTCKRAACQSLCDAFPARLLQRKPVRAEPGPKSGSCFDLTSLRALHQERGARVAGYLTSGPAGAAGSALLMLPHTCAKPRGRQSFLVPRIIAASTCCTLNAGLAPQAITIFALFQRVDQAVPELAVPAAAAWLLRRTAQLPAWAPLLFRLVAMEENSAAKVGPPALGVLSSSLSLVADLLSMAGLFLWLQVPCWFVTQSALPGSRFCSPPLCCWLDFGGLVMSSGFLPAAWTGGPVLRWFLSGRLTLLRALLQDLVSVTLGVRISWHLRLDLGFSFCFPLQNWSAMFSTISTWQTF